MVLTREFPPGTTDAELADAEAELRGQLDAAGITWQFVGILAHPEGGYTMTAREADEWGC